MFLAPRNVSTSTVRNSLDSAKFDLNPKLSRCGALHIGVQLKGDLKSTQFQLLSRCSSCCSVTGEPPVPDQPNTGDYAGRSR